MLVLRAPLVAVGGAPLTRLVRDDAEPLDLLDRATVGPKHVHRDDAHNVSIKPDHGNARAYALRRLRKGRPDRHDAVGSSSVRSWASWRAVHGAPARGSRSGAAAGSPGGFSTAPRREGARVFIDAERRRRVGTRTTS